MHLSYIAGESRKWNSHFEKQFAVPYKCKCTHNLHTSNSISRHLSKINENMFTKRHVQECLIILFLEIEAKRLNDLYENNHYLHVIGHMTRQIVVYYRQWNT